MIDESNLSIENAERKFLDAKRAEARAYDAYWELRKIRQEAEDDLADLNAAADKEVQS